jgi:hypothetical protein
MTVRTFSAQNHLNKKTTAAARAFQSIVSRILSSSGTLAGLGIAFAIFIVQMERD